MNKDLKKEYENRSYVSRDKYKELEEEEEQIDIGEEIAVKRETTEVKVTYAIPSNTNRIKETDEKSEYEEIINRI